MQYKVLRFNKLLHFLVGNSEFSEYSEYSESASFFSLLTLGFGTVFSFVGDFA